MCSISFTFGIRYLCSKMHVHGMCCIAMPTRLKSTFQKDGVWRAGVVAMVVFGNSFVACPLYGLDKELAIPADSSIH